MFRYEEDKEKPRFPIKRLSAAAGKVPTNAQAEWECCHSREDAIKWHLKWTPWWTKDMIEGVVDKAYSALAIKQQILKRIAQEKSEKNIAIEKQIRLEEEKAAPIFKRLDELIMEDELRAKAIEDEARRKEAERVKKQLEEEEAKKKQLEEEETKKKQLEEEETKKKQLEEEETKKKCLEEDRELQTGQEGSNQAKEIKLFYSPMTSFIAKTKSDNLNT